MLPRETRKLAFMDLSSTWIKVGLTWSLTSKHTFILLLSLDGDTRFSQLYSTVPKYVELTDEVGDRTSVYPNRSRFIYRRRGNSTSTIKTYMNPSREKVQRPCTSPNQFMKTRPGCKFRQDAVFNHFSRRLALSWRRRMRSSTEISKPFGVARLPKRWKILLGTFVDQYLEEYQD
jgi:hypothetical protein